jgi:hypothetical protein
MGCTRRFIPAENTSAFEGTFLSKPKSAESLHIMRKSVVMHHVVLLLIAHPDIALLDRLPNVPDHGGRLHLGGPLSRRRTLLDDGPGGRVGWRRDGLLVDVLHVCLEVRLLLELLCTERALVLALDLTLAVDAEHVSSQAALPLELLKADVAVVPCSLMFSLVEML